MTKIQVNSQGKAYLTSAGKALAGVQPTLVTKSITENGTYNASSDNADGYSSVTVNVGGGNSSELPSYQVSSGVVSKKSMVLTGTEFLNIENIDTDGLHYAFYGCGFSGYLNLVNLVSVGSMGMHNAFSDCLIETINLDNLVSVGNLGMFQAFNGCHISSCNFKKLSDISESFALRNAFQSQGNYLTDLYFPSLTTQSFGSTYTNQFTTMVTGVNGTTIHFPSNLQSTISGLNGYPSFGGGNITLAFDLPATT